MSYLFFYCNIWVERMKERFLEPHTSFREQPELRKLKSAPLSPNEVIEELLGLTGKPWEEVVPRRSRGLERAIVMEMLYRYCGISQTEIGRIMGGVDYSAVSLARRRLRDKIKNDKGLMIRFEKLKNALSEIKK